jgi:UDP-glucose 4-epimerase
VRASPGPNSTGSRVPSSCSNPAGLEQLLGTRDPVELGPGLARTLAWWDPEKAGTDGPLESRPT